MHPLRLAFVACLAASFSLMSPVGAAPLAAPDAQPTAQTMVVPVGGCHADVRRHYVPEYGRTATHRHRRYAAPGAVRPLLRPPPSLSTVPSL